MRDFAYYESQIEKLRTELAEAREQIEEACSARDQWKATWAENNQLRKSRDHLKAQLEVAMQSIEDAEFIIAGSTAIEGQEDKDLELRERAFERFFETRTKIARIGEGK